MMKQVGPAVITRNVISSQQLSNYYGTCLLQDLLTVVMVIVFCCLDLKSAVL